MSLRGVVFPLHRGSEALQGRKPLCGGKNIYLAIKQQLFRSHFVCRVPRRAKFQGSVNGNGSECIYLRVFTPLPSASSHQHQLKPEFDLRASGGAERSPHFLSTWPLWSARVGLSVHQEHIVAAFKPHTARRRQNVPHELSQAREPKESLRVPAKNHLGLNHALSRLVGKSGELSRYFNVPAPPWSPADRPTAGRRMLFPFPRSQVERSLLTLLCFKEVQ